jgi:hypothetical protein
MLSQVLFDQPRHPVCFSLSTKDRVPYTLEAIQGLAFEGAFDLLWFDGSASPEGRQLPGTLAPTLGCLREIHTGVTGGPDFAIFAALVRMLELGYGYCGLLENDIRLSPGWFDALMATIAAGQADGLAVGAVTARAFNRRVLFHRPSYAVTKLTGAGMILFTRAAAEIVVGNYRTTTGDEAATCISAIAGSDRADPDGQDTRTASDLVYETHLMRHGLCVLSTLPVLGRNLDDVDPTGLLGGYAAPDPTAARADAAAFAVFGRRCATIRATVEPYNPPYLYFASMGLWCLYLHHLLFTRDSPATVRGRWKIVWEKFNGPFAFEALDPDCEIAFPLHGALRGVFCSRTADGAIVELVQGARVLAACDTRYPQAIRDQFFTALTVAPSGTDPVRMRLAAPADQASTGRFIRLSGLCFEQPQPWLPMRADLDGPRLARILERQSRDGSVSFEPPGAVG